MAATGDRVDPYLGYNFRIEIDGAVAAGFREVSGLSLTTDPVEYREGTDPLHVRKLRGLRKAANISCKRGISKNRDLWALYDQVRTGGAAFRFGGSVILRDEEDNDVLRWEFSEGWICKWEGPAFNATATEVAIESIEICVETVEQR